MFAHKAVIGQRRFQKLLIS